MFILGGMEMDVQFGGPPADPGANPGLETCYHYCQLGFYFEKLIFNAVSLR
jgi:hypothetical protein